MDLNIGKETIQALKGPWIAGISHVPDYPQTAVVRDDQGWSVAFLPGVDAAGRPHAEKLGSVSALPVLLDVLHRIAVSDYTVPAVRLIDEARVAMRYLGEKIEEARKIGPFGRVG